MRMTVVLIVALIATLTGCDSKEAAAQSKSLGSFGPKLTVSGTAEPAPLQPSKDLFCTKPIGKTSAEILAAIERPNRPR